MEKNEGHKISHRCTTDALHDSEVADIDLLSPLKIRKLQLKNRIVMSPMCQYSAVDGLANDWHLVHLGSRAVGGASVIFVEATAVVKEGRISLGDLGIWSDEHIAPLQKIASFIDSQGAIPAIQLAHAGRKAGHDVPWNGGEFLHNESSWNRVAPSPIAFQEQEPTPKELNETDIDTIVLAFEAAAKRALCAGFKIIEIHSAHGYLLHEFLSPLSNQRKDEYGGSLENRMRLLLRITKKLREAIPESLPLFVRISGTDWVEEGWDIEQSVELCRHLKNLGVDLIDVSSGGVVAKANIPIGKGYQVPLSRTIRCQAEIKTGAVGLITEVQHANEIITAGDADLIFIGRELLRDPYWPLKAERDLANDCSWPKPYGYAVKRRTK